MLKPKKEPIFATPAQTQRWVKCVNNWAKANKKTQDDICEALGFAWRSCWNSYSNGARKRVRLNIMRESIKAMGLDSNFINGVYDFKSKFTETRNIFTDFKEEYFEYISKGNQYQAGQIVRKAAMFVFETLVPRDIIIKLEIINKRNLVEMCRISCTYNEVEYFFINVFGGPKCVMFTMSRRFNNVDIPIFEGDLDISAVSSIKHQIVVRRKKEQITTSRLAKFEDNAKKFTI